MTNNDGMGGKRIEHIAVEQSTLIGVQSPNKFPSYKEKDKHTKIPTLSFKETTGLQIQDELLYDCEVVDTSWLHPGGIYTLGVGNKWTTQVGSGGIQMTTIGNIMNKSEIAIHQGNKGFFIQTKFFQVLGAERIMIAGKRIDFDAAYSQFMGNVGFTNNILVQGGAYINGELICNHITTQKQANTTSMSEDTQGYINPNMSFHVFQGYSSAAQKYTPKSLLGVVFEGLDITDADDNVEWIEAELAINTDFIEQIIPGLDKVGLSIIKMILALPIKLKFPKGINLISDATDHQNPTIYTQMKMQPRLMGDAKDKSDLFGPGHQHTFYGPACGYLKTTQEVYNAGKAVLGEKPIVHKSVAPNGADSLEKAMEEGKQMITDYMKKYAKQMLSFFMPSWFSGGGAGA